MVAMISWMMSRKAQRCPRYHICVSNDHLERVNQCKILETFVRIRVSRKIAKRNCWRMDGDNPAALHKSANVEALMATTSANRPTNMQTYETVLIRKELQRGVGNNYTYQYFAWIPVPAKV
mmetsp:Transcript_6633/g.19451  ORF Transcript_6633/g.19451 Transcript_6633/m.19451 type:complete len:121 (+) Transcript_6633:233-595(+)